MTCRMQIEFLKSGGLNNILIDGTDLNGTVLLSFQNNREKRTGVKEFLKKNYRTV
jgi:hypothetical protein